MTVLVIDDRPADACAQNSMAQVDFDSWFERGLIRNIVKPLSKYVVPRWLKPNTLSIMNSAALVWALLCAYSAMLCEDNASLAWGLHVSASFLVFGSTVMDCLDGVHARATGQSSHLGEVIDHALDTGNTPIIGFTTMISLHVDKWNVAIGLFVSGLVFNAQLLIYRRCRVMIAPPINGVEAQTIASFLIIFVGTLSFSFGRHSSQNVEWLVCALSWWSNLMQFRCMIYLLSRLDRRSAPHFIVFAVHQFVLVAAYLSGVISEFGFVLSTVALQFRMSGAYVTFTVANNVKMSTEEAASTNIALSQVSMPDANGSHFKPITSTFTSLYSGFDVSALFSVALFVTNKLWVPDGLVKWLSLGWFSSASEIAVQGYTSNDWYRSTTPCTAGELTVAMLMCMFLSTVMWFDVKKCLKFLASNPKENWRDGLFKLLF